jgi:TPP-dependent trihydroxycyclohexane-1,2-dione (THcHDO) dehydratase
MMAQKYYKMKDNKIKYTGLEDLVKAAKEARSPKPSDIQVGGGHYAKFKIQPTEFIHANNVPFIEGNVIKYVLRHREKNGIEDLKKARHYIDLLIQFEYESTKRI